MAATVRPMKKSKSSEFLLEIVTLLVIVIAVQTFYAMVVRPTAEAIRSADLARMAKDPNYVPELKPWVIVKDPEQEVCFIFTFWALTIMGVQGCPSRARAAIAGRGPAAPARGHEDPARRTRGTTRGRSRRCPTTCARSCCLAR